jgi:hypothetical protein
MRRLINELYPGTFPSKQFSSAEQERLRRIKVLLLTVNAREGLLMASRVISWMLAPVRGSDVP